MSGSLADHDRAAAVPDRSPTEQLAAVLDRLQLRLARVGAAVAMGFAITGMHYTAMAASMLAPGADRLLLFHVVAEGKCWIAVDDGERIWAEAGDVVVIPYGDTHERGGTADAEVVDIRMLMNPPPWSEMPFIAHGGGGDSTHVVCGYLQCDDPLFDPALQVFPKVFVVRPTGPAAAWVRASVDYATGQTTQVADDRFEVPTTIPQLLLVEVLKLHLASAPAAGRGFVRALSDPVVAPVMGLIHDEPARKWTVAELAARQNVSVSLLDERFREALGMPPIRYLTSWRMHLAQELLLGTDLGVATIARQVGYESEEAFSRAFKREFGLSPMRWRDSQTA